MSLHNRTGKGGVTPLFCSAENARRCATVYYSLHHLYAAFFFCLQLLFVAVQAKKEMGKEN